MIDPKLPRDFLSTAGYGDVLAAALALGSIFALRSNTRAAVPLVWIFSAWGFLDMLNGMKSTFQLNVASFDLGTFWYIYIFYAALVIVTRVMIVWIWSGLGPGRNSISTSTKLHQLAGFDLEIKERGNG